MFHLIIGFFIIFRVSCQADPTSDISTNSNQGLTTQIDALMRDGKYSEALPFAKQWLTNCETSTGPGSTNSATAMSVLGTLLAGIGNYTSAEPLFQNALDIRGKAFGTNSLETGVSLSSLAGLYCSMGDYSKAEPLYLKSVDIHESVLGKNSAGCATALNDLAGLYERTGNFLKAKPLFERSLEIYEKIFGSESRYSAASLNNLAGLYYNMGDYQQAEAYFKQSLKICEEVLGPENLHTASVLNSMASVYIDMGDYSKAEPLCKRGLSIKEKILGPEDPETATSLNNLASVYAGMGDNTKAESLYQESLSIREKVLGPDNPDTIMSLNNLAQLYDTIGDHAKAENMFNQCLMASLKVLGPESMDTASVMDNFAKCYCHVGEIAKAEQMYLKSLQIREKVLGAEHSDTAISLNNLALLYMNKGDYADAEPLYLRSFGIMAGDFATEYPAMSDFYRGLGLLMIDLEHGDKASDAARREILADEAEVGEVLSFASERQRMEFQVTRRPYDLLAALGDDSDLAEAVLRNKGVVLDSLLEDGLAAQGSKNPEVQTNLEQLRELGRNLSSIEIDWPSISDHKQAAEFEANRKQLEQKIEDLQGVLARNVKSQGPVRRAVHIKIPEVQSELNSNTMLLEFVRYNYYLGKVDFEPHYGVVLIYNSKNPMWVPLGNATNIEQNLQEYEQTMRGEKRGDATVLKNLYSELIAPVLRKLPANVSTLIISPDSELNFLSFATLVNGQDQFLAERYQIKYVSSGRDLVYGRTATNVNPELAVFSDPEFNGVPGLVATNATDLTMLSSDMRDYNGISLPRLPNTAQEAAYLTANSLAWHLKPAAYTGTAATEAQVKALHSPYILHLATHGFFLPDTEMTNRPGNFGLKQKMPVILHNPMQRSGLALAGAQLTLDSWQKGEAPDTENDGILMADEVAMLDLQNTWLVTLSACDTGLGEARAGEGVLGLRRGFIQAGAQNLLMTLWPVSDKWTVDLMEAFYDRAMKTGDAPGALADVQRDFLVKLKKEKGLVMAARLAGPFVMNFQGKPSNN
jgi:CHAT domain-containing protein/Tfp pilus assembly protein PilF